MLRTAFLGAVLSIGSSAIAQSLPNLIVVYTDDQRVDALAAAGNSKIRTPNLDRLAARGRRFTNASVVFALCSPSRAALLTGRYGSGNGVTNLGGALRAGEQTFAQLLRKKGYRTAMVGKWHLKTKVPAAGFDFRCYFRSNGRYHKRPVFDNGRKVKPEEHVDAYCVQRSIDFLTEAAKGDKPFVLFHNTQLPHMDHRQSWPSKPAVRATYKDTQMPLPKTWRGDLRGKPPHLASIRNRTQAEKYGYQNPAAIQRHTGDYYSVVTELDAMLGRLFNAVDRLGLNKNTYIVFMSDNGWLLGEHRMTSKLLAYAPSVRVPMVVTGPDVKKGVEARLALNIDVAPTLLQLAGVPVPSAMHGRSLVPLLRGEKTNWRQIFVYEGLGTYGGNRPTLAACTDRWRLIYTYADRDALAGGDKPKFIELYDLQSDPNESRNLVGGQDMRLRFLQSRLRAAIDNHIKTHLQAKRGREMRRLTKGQGARSFSGIYPHLASFNTKNECGTGALVPWADMLWWVTYAPHEPKGSDDKLYAMNNAGDLLVFPDSIGGTPANRMIHSESQQLFIGPYAINAKGKVRTIPYQNMHGRLTGNARHLTSPSRKIYYATMEEGIYEVDVRSLAVKTLFTDTHDKKRKRETGLPGYHGKGLYSGHGMLIYANNGEHGRAARTRPETPSGVLAQWNGKGKGRGKWQVVRRNQFTEVTGPGGIHGNRRPAIDPVWSVGWDHRSLLLMLRSTRKKASGDWYRFRLPKSSHSYDGAHGWNTEWPRIRDIGEDDMLMTMHGAFWRFPRNFELGKTAGVAPRSNYLKVIGDFCRYKDQLVFGCDDAAKAEFLNTRRAKGKLAGPAESQSNLWFAPPAILDRVGPVLGRGGVFVQDDVRKGQWSDPMLFDGYDMRTVHLVHDADRPVSYRFQIDKGDGKWQDLQTVAVDAKGYRFVTFGKDQRAAWVRVATDQDCKTTVWFHYRNRDKRQPTAGNDFAKVLEVGAAGLGGLVRAGDRETGLQVLATKLDGKLDGKSHAATGYYELQPNLQLVPVRSTEKAKWMTDRVALTQGVLRKEGNSVLYIDDKSRRWRLPIGNSKYGKNPALMDLQRASREVATERDLFQCAGTFFELPARNAGGFAKIRPVSTHGKFVQDYCSWRGLLVMTGLQTKGDDPHVIRSKDNKCAVWLGGIDDLWRLGKPSGVGGPWSQDQVQAKVPSDPYLMTGYHRKSLQLHHDQPDSVEFTIQVDITGTGSWQSYHNVAVAAGKPTSFEFPIEFAAYWVRFVTDRDCRATATLTYR